MRYSRQPQPHLHAAERARQSELVQVSQVPNAEDAPVELAEAGPQGHVEALEDDLAESVGVVPVGEQDRGQRVRVLARVDAVALEAPGGDGRAGGLGEAPVPRENTVEPFLPEHGEGLAQAEEQACRGRVGEEAARVGGEMVVPTEVGVRQRGSGAVGQRPLADRCETEARRQHEPLLRPGHGHVDAPFVMAEVDGREGRYGVDHEERRVAGGVDGGADVGDGGGHAGRGLVVHDHHRADAPVGVAAEPVLHQLRLDPGAPVARQQVDLESEAPSHLRPLAGEEAAVEGQHAVPGGEGVDQRRLPRAGGRGGEDEDGAVGLEDGLEVLEDCQSELGELRAAVVDHRSVHGAPDPLGYVGGAGELEEVPAAACGHSRPRVTWREPPIRMRRPSATNPAS